MPDNTPATAEQANNTDQQLAPVPKELSLVEQAIAIEERKFALAQRQAKVYADSALVPKEYQGSIGNVLIAQNMAKRMGADTLMVMQNLYIVHGKPGWSAAFLIASFNSNGRFSAIKYRFKGSIDAPEEWGCQAYCTEISTGDVIEGTWITWDMANREGWVNKNGSKWKTMPEQMFRYRAATFLIRSTAPEIGMGLLTKDELEDMGPTNGEIAQRTQERANELRERLTAGKEQDSIAEAEIIDAEPVDDEAEPGFINPQSPMEAGEPAPIQDGEESEPEDPAISELAKLRANVQSALEELPKTRQKDLMQGRTFIKNATAEELTELAALIEKEKASA